MNPLEVLPYDGVFRCLVRSAKNPKKVYLVDLEANSGAGFCGCWQFQYRLLPQITRLSVRDRRASGTRYSCKHILRAREVRGSQLLDSIMAMRREGKK